MTHDDRRKELGKMLMDIAKYLATVGLIGGILTTTLTLSGGVAITIFVLLLAFIGFYTIPPKKEV